MSFILFYIVNKNMNDIIKKRYIINALFWTIWHCYTLGHMVAYGLFVNHRFIFKTTDIYFIFFIPWVELDECNGEIRNEIMCLIITLKNIWK